MIDSKLHDIDYLLNTAEGRYFDRKAAEYDKRKVANTLISFANADGGTIALGIKNRKLEGIDHLNPHKINDFEKVGYDLIKPALRVECEYLKVTIKNKNNRIMLLSVKPSSDKVYSNVRDEVFLRVGDDTKQLSYKEIESLEFDKGLRHYEQEIVPEALLDDLDTRILNEYKRLYGYNGDNVWKLLFSRGLAKRNINESGKIINYQLTVAGVLLLAKNPGTFIPGARIRFIRYGGKKAGVGTDLNVIKQDLIEGPLTVQIKKARNIVQSQLREFTNLDENSGKFITVPEYPKDTWLEGIVNAVTHRAYNLNGDDIRIIMYDDKLVIHSPGNLPSIVTVDNIRTTHYSRNPNIALALVEFGWVREFGEGVDRMYKSMEKYFLEDPEYKVSNTFTELTLKNNILTRNQRRKEDIRDIINCDWESLNSNEHTILIYAYENEKIRPKDVISKTTSMKETTVRNTLKKLTQKGILERIGTSKNDPNSFYKLIIKNK